jgi:CDP-paratose 2-epimerase
LKVLVTGGCGFLGSYVCEYYANKKAKVVSFDSLTKYELARTGYATEAARSYNWDFLKGLGAGLVKGDIRNLDELLKAADGCDYIIHTAAQPAMTISIESPGLDFSTNVLGTFNVLETARKFDIPVVYCSTIHVYGNKINETLKGEETRYIRDQPTIDEQHSILQGTLTPLHASKRSAEIYVQTYIDTYGLEAAVFRLTGLYGPRQFGGEDHGWVANFTIRTILGKPITIFGTGKQVRDILYASDVAEAFEAFYKARKSGIYNIGGGIECAISLNECLQLIEKITGKKPRVQYEPTRLGDLWYFVCNISKAKESLRWAPKVRPQEGVAKLAGWVEENRNIFR